jgi:putative FmdB family regulatory protein
MPIYEYECRKCGETHEILQKMSEGPKRKCPSCGAMSLKKLVSAAAFQLKGTGWYVTDFRDKGKKKEKKTDGKDSSKTEKSDSKSESKSSSKDSKAEAAA